MNQITSFLDEHQLDSSQILNEADITSKILILFLIFLNTIVNTVSSLGVAVGSILFITFFFLNRLMFIEGAKN
jgi:hypothetical protein